MWKDEELTIIGISSYELRRVPKHGSDVFKIEHKENVRQCKLGKRLSASHREALKVGWIKRKARGLGRHTEEFKAALGDRFRGAHQSEDQKRKKDSANREATKLHNPEWRKWAGRKGAAIQNGRAFNDPEPPLYLSDKGE